MKSGAFAQDDNAPQMADKYDALRPNRELIFIYGSHLPTDSLAASPLVAQPTGWGGFGGANGYQGGGYGYQ